MPIWGSTFNTIFCVLVSTSSFYQQKKSRLPFCFKKKAHWCCARIFTCPYLYLSGRGAGRRHAMPCLGGFELEAREGGEVSHGSSQEE